MEAAHAARRAGAIHDSGIRLLVESVLPALEDDGQSVYATFDRGVTGTGGIAVVNVRTREVVNAWAYPGQGRPHGIWYSRKKVRQ